MHVVHRHHARSEVALGRFHGLPAERRRGPGRGHNADLGRARKPGRRLGGARRDPHRDRGRGADALEVFHHLRPGVEGRRHLRSSDSYVARIDEHERIGRIDQRDRNASRAFDLEEVEDVAGGEERARDRTARVEEFQIHRGAGARYAGNRGFPFDGRTPVLHREPRPDELAGVGVVDDHDAFRSARFDHPLVHREGSDGRRHVPAVAAPVDLGTVHCDLAERVVHVRVEARWRPDDADLG